MNDFYAELARLHAPLLLLGAPLIGAAIAAAIPQARMSWLGALLACAIALALAVDLAARGLLSGAPIASAHEALALSPDGVGMFAAPILTGALALALLAGGGLLDEIGPRKAPWAWALSLAVCAGWIGALFAGDLIGVFIAAEIAWLASVGLAALSRGSERGALSGALRMLTAGGFSAALMLLGIGLIGRAVGSVVLDEIGALPIAAPHLATLGVALVTTALAVKAGVAPLHFWSAAAYGRSGRFALFVAVVGLVGALMTLTRIVSIATAAPDLGEGVSSLLAILGAASVLIGSVQAVGAVNLHRLAAYAAASHAGSILLSLALGSPAGLAAALVQTFALAVALLALFGGASVAREPALSALDGLARRAPLASMAITAGALSFMGAPLTVGFLGRWRLIEASIGAGWWWAAGAALVSSLAAVFYGGRLIERVFFRRATTAVDVDRNPWRLAITPVLVIAIIAIGLGFEPSVLLRAATDAAALQLGRAP